MSTLFNIHAVQPYVSVGSNKTAPLSGQRLSKITYKVNKETGIKPDSKCVSIPVIGWNEVQPYISTLSAVIVDMVHQAQDKIVRELVEAGKTEVSDNDIRLEAVIDSMIAESNGRITGEVIRAWFSDALKEPLLIAFASKLGIPEDKSPTAEQEKKLQQVLKGYEDSFSKLASGAATFTQLQRDNMLKALDLVDSDDAMKERFISRLNKEPKKEEDLLMSL